MKRWPLLFVVAWTAFAAFACSHLQSRASSPEPALKTLSVEQVASRLAAHDGKTFIYDNNPKSSYNAGHLPGAHWLQFDAVTARALPADRSATLIFYCHNKA